MWGERIELKYVDVEVLLVENRRMRLTVWLRWRIEKCRVIQWRMGGGLLLYMYAKGDSNE